MNHGSWFYQKRKPKNFNSRLIEIQNIYKFQKQFDIEFPNSKYPKKSVIVFDGNVVFGHFPSRDGCKLQDQWSDDGLYKTIYPNS